MIICCLYLQLMFHCHGSSIVFTPVIDVGLREGEKNTHKTQRSATDFVSACSFYRQSGFKDYISRLCVSTVYGFG